MFRTFITGASGFLGQHLLNKLIQKNVFVKALVHKSPVISNPNIHTLTGDLLDAMTFAEELQGVDTIFNLAGIVTDWAPSKLYFDTHVSGLEGLIKEAIKKNVKRIISISSIDAQIKVHRGVLLDDGEYYRANIPYNRSKADAETTAKKYQEQIDIIFVRPAWIFGPGDRTFIPEIAYQLKKGKMMFLGNKNNLIPLVFVDNLCDFLIQIAESRNTIYKSFLIADGEIKFVDLCSMIAHSLGVEIPKITLPYRLAYGLSLFFEFFSWATESKSRPLLTRTAVEQLGKSISVNPERAKKVFHYRPKIGLEDALSLTMEWLKSNSVEKLRIK